MEENEARDLLRKEGRYNEFAVGDEWYERERTVVDKLIEENGSYTYLSGITQIKEK